MDLKSRAKFWVRQFPFIVPKNMIHSCQHWILNQRKRKGQYYNQRGPWSETIFPESFLHLNGPVTLGLPNEKAFSNNKSFRTDKSTLFYLQNSYLFGHKGLVLTIDHRVFQEFSHHFAISSLKKFLWKNPFYTFTKNFKRIDGTGAVLVSPESHNYYHWLNDVLPRIKLYESVSAEIDYFCVSSNVPSKFLEILPDFGIPANKILLIKDGEKLRFDHLYVSSLPGSEGRSPRWAIDYLRDKLIKLPVPAKPARNIYFKRGINTDRRILNEDSIINTLKNIGFEIIEPDRLTIYEQINLMQQAKIVISAHGAALSNLLFSQHNLMVIELFSPDYLRTDCYYTLSCLLKLNYWYIIGEKPTGANWGDIIAPEEILIKTIQQANVS